MDEYYIYRIVNTINNHDYIGRKKKSKTVEPLKDNYWGSGILIKKAIQKYGKEAFRKEILESNISFEEAIKKEIYWIEKFKEEGKGYYNISPGAEGIKLNSNLNFDEEYLNKYNSYKSEKIKNNWKNLSKEDYNKRINNMSKAWNNKDEELKIEFKNKRSKIQKDVYRKLSIEEKESINTKRSNSLKRMHQNRSDIYKKEINEKISQSLINYNKNLSAEEKNIKSKKLSIAQKEYLKKETAEHRKQRSINQSLAQGKYYKLKDPNGNEFIIKALAFWCRQTFGDKGNSAASTLRQSGSYKGYKFLGECKAPLN